MEDVIQLLNSPTSLHAEELFDNRILTSGLDISMGLRDNDDLASVKSQDSFLERIQQEDMMEDFQYFNKRLPSSSSRHLLDDPIHYVEPPQRSYDNNQQQSFRKSKKAIASSHRHSKSRNNQLYLESNNKKELNSSTGNRRNNQKDRDLIASLKLRMEGQLGAIHELERQVREKDALVEKYKRRSELRDKQMRAMSQQTKKSEKEILSKRTTLHSESYQHRKSEERLQSQIQSLVKQVNSHRLRESHLSQLNSSLRSRITELRDTCDAQSHTIELQERNVKELKLKVKRQRVKLKECLPSKKLVENLPPTGQLLRELQEITRKQEAEIIMAREDRIQVEERNTRTAAKTSPLPPDLIEKKETNAPVLELRKSSKDEMSLTTVHEDAEFVEEKAEARSATSLEPAPVIKTKTRAKNSRKQSMLIKHLPKSKEGDGSNRRRTTLAFNVDETLTKLIERAPKDTLLTVAELDSEIDRISDEYDNYSGSNSGGTISPSSDSSM